VIASSLNERAFSGTGTARHLGPTPRGRLKFGRMLACRTRTARNRRVKDVRRSVAGPLSAASARYLPIGDSDFGAVDTAPYVGYDIICITGVISYTVMITPGRRVIIPRYVTILRFSAISHRSLFPEVSEVSHCLPPYRASHSSFDGFESTSHRNAVNESITVRRPDSRVRQPPSWLSGFESGVQNQVRPPVLTATLYPDRGTAEPSCTLLRVPRVAQAPVAASHAAPTQPRR